MAIINGGNGNDSYNLANASAGADTFYTALGGDYAQASAGNDTYYLGFVASRYYWTNSFYDFDTVDYRYANDSYGVGDKGIELIADLQLGTVEKLDARTGAVLGTDRLVGADAVWGTAASDLFFGRDFWDFEEFQGFGGNDFFDGRGGTDGVSYINATTTAGIAVKLADGVVKWKDGISGSDTLRQIEVITGTNFADTYDATGYGDTSANRNSLGATFNLYNPQGGNDTIIGNGDTILNYGTSLGGGISVNLSALVNPAIAARIVTAFSDDASSASGITPGTILASGVNAVRGGHYNDTLIGGGRVNTNGFTDPLSGDLSFESFRGNGGNDFIDGKTGYDRAEYNVGNQSQGIVVKLAAGTVSGDPRWTGSDKLRGIEGIGSTYLDDIYDARGFTLSNAASKSVNHGDGKIVLNVSGETLASYAFNEFRAYGGNDTVTGNDATRISFTGLTLESLTGPRPSVDIVFDTKNSGSGSYGNTDGGFGYVTFTGVRSIYGSTADDRIVGSSGYQILRGYYGNDSLYGGDGNDELRGFSGTDGALTNPTTLFSDNDRLDAGAGNDLLYGEFGNDTLIGGLGADTMEGGTGNDTLTGGAGNDTLSGGAGSDMLSGGGGNDLFRFDSKLGSDKVSDFSSVADTFQFSQAGIRIGDGDVVVDGFAVRTASGGFSKTTEVVVFTPNAASLTTAAAAKVIGSATSSFAAGDTRLFVVDNGTDSGIFLFTSSAANAQVSAAELTLISSFNGVQSAQADYVFLA